MKNRIIMTAMALVFTFAFTNANAKTEKIEFQSRSPYDLIHILDGVENDPEAIVYGKLTIPKADGKVPAVVFMHGSGGPNSKKYGQWFSLFKKMKIAVFALDSFKGRKIKSSVGNQTRVTGVMMTADAYMALKILANHPKIDKNKIGIIGSSKGGAVSIYAAWEPVRLAMVGDELKFAYHIALYPICFKWEKLEFTKSPILILSGEKDDYTPAQFCVDFVDSLLASGYDNVKLIVYPGAYHSFDAHYDVTKYSKGYSFTECDLRIKADGESWEATTGMSFAKQDTKMKGIKGCAKKGVTIGKNNAAKKQAKKDVASFVASAIGL